MTPEANELLRDVGPICQEHDLGLEPAGLDRRADVGGEPSDSRPETPFGGPNRLGDPSVNPFMEPFARFDSPFDFGGERSSFALTHVVEPAESLIEGRPERLLRRTDIMTQ